MTATDIVTEDAIRAQLADLQRQVGVLHAQHAQMMDLLQREFVRQRDAMGAAANERRAVRETVETVALRVHDLERDMDEARPVVRAVRRKSAQAIGALTLLSVIGGMAWGAIKFWGAEIRALFTGG